MKHFDSRSFRGLGLVLLSGASSCTLYQPLLNMLPAVRKPGQGAVALNGSFPYGVQGTATLSPLPHTLVFAGGGLHAYNVERDSSNNYARNRQYEVGIGGYFNVKQTWLSATVGGGRARGYRYGKFGSSDSGGGFGILGLPTGGKARWTPVPELLGYYNTRFVQLTGWWQDARHPNQEIGASLRLNQVQFTQLTLNGEVQPLPATQHYVQLAIVTQKPLWRQLRWQAAASWDFSSPLIPANAALARAPLRVWAGLVLGPRQARVQ
ncbi:hypothetical protein Q5H92_08565 [Hymenobacter sp. M29]|uniref:YjbH domain-containing protein n=1 Tax=Hymenobacter mellowenesis TaxID=3063995 RepID=A0ABT9A995_9BACT|nr:hypothetical protein [Hymenobacter sp. M29]MDO7846406.1 hypothetical protein [Hymenobacter sp. M29]